MEKKLILLDGDKTLYYNTKKNSTILNIFDLLEKKGSILNKGEIIKKLLTHTYKNFNQTLEDIRNISNLDIKKILSLEKIKELELQYQDEPKHFKFYNDTINFFEALEEIRKKVVLEFV